MSCPMKLFLMNLLFEIFTVLQMVWGSGNATQLGLLSPPDRIFGSNLDHYIENENLGPDAFREELNVDDVSVDYEPQDIEVGDYINDYTINKRSAQERGTKGKSRKIEKPNKQGTNKKLELQSNVTDTVSENNLKTSRGKYLPKRKPRLQKGNKSSVAYNHGNDAVAKSFIPENARFYEAFPEFKDGLNKEFMGEEVKDAFEINKQNLSNDASNQNIHYSSNNILPDGTSKYMHNIKHNNPYSNKGKVNRVHPDISRSDKDLKQSAKKFKKHKNINGKFTHLDKTENQNVDNNNKSYIGNQQRNNLDKHSVLTQNIENQQKYGLEDNTDYANISVINQGFLDSAEKRYLKSLLSEDLLNYKSKAKLIDSLSKSKYFNEVFGRTNQEFTNQRIHMNEKEKSTIGHYPNRNLNYQEIELPTPTLTNNKEDVIVDDMKEHVLRYTNQKASTLSSNIATTTVASVTKRKDESVHGYSDSLKKNRILNKINDSTVVLPPPENLVVSKLKHNNRGKKKKILENEFNGKKHNYRLPNKDRGAPVYRLLEDFDTNKLGHVKRIERGLNSNIFEENNYGSRKHIARNIFDDENRDQIDDRTQEDEHIPDSVNDAEDEENQEMQSHQRVHTPKDSERHVKYSQRTKNENDGEESEVVSEEDYKKLHARRAHEFGYNGDECLTIDTCVGYKSGQVSNDSELITATERSRLTSSTKRSKNVKVKTTPGVRNKSMTTTKVNSEVGTNVTYLLEVSNYEQYLCGELASTYVNAVLIKVHRSKKMLKELGFSNETEESCERCIETKTNNKIPDLETIKATLGRCTRTSDSKQNTAKCYGIQNSMVNFLNVLLSFGKEHENTVYNKIRDDSSFIFTGDYSESLSRNDELKINNKYLSHSDLFSKDSSEKQHLKDEENEEKSDHQILSNNYFEIDKHVSPSEKINEEDTTEVAEGESEEQSEQRETETKSNQNDNTKTKEHLDESSEQHSLQSDENLKGDLIDVFDTQDGRYHERNTYSNFKNTDIGEPLDVDPIEHKRKEKLRNMPNNYNSELNMKHSKQLHKNQNYNEFNVYPDKRSHSPDIGTVDDIHLESRTGNQHGQSWQRYKNPFQVNNERHHSENTNVHLPRTVFKENELSKYDKRNNYFGYAPHEHIVDNRISRNKNIKPRNFISDNVENGEYQLYPNELGESEKDNSLNMMSLTGQSKNYYNDKLMMGKREADAYEDEAIFFEIPDIEYDLY